MRGPILKREEWNHKAGRYDCHRFDHISTGAGAAYRSFGEVGVDCRFNFKDSRFGVLGENENEAGIIYLEINFNLPPGHRLVWARTQLTLDDGDPRLVAYGQKDMTASADGLPVLITDHYGPVHLVGALGKRSVKKSWKLNPSPNIGGQGATPGNMDPREAFDQECRWAFRSYKVNRRRRQGRGAGDNILRWEMAENTIGRYPVYHNKVFTAFAYEHSGQPFLMKVEICGRLERRRGRCREKLKFGPLRGREEGHISTTLIGPYKGDRLPLDRLAEGLAADMETKNRDNMALEIASIQSQTRPLPDSEPEESSAEESREDTRPAPPTSGPSLEELAEAGSSLEIPVRRHPRFPEEASTSSDPIRPGSSLASTSTFVGGEGLEKPSDDNISGLRTEGKAEAWSITKAFIVLLSLLWEMALKSVTSSLGRGNMVRKEDDGGSGQAQKS